MCGCSRLKRSQIWPGLPQAAFIWGIINLPSPITNPPKLSMTTSKPGHSTREMLFVVTLATSEGQISNPRDFSLISPKSLRESDNLWEDQELAEWEEIWAPTTRMMCMKRELLEEVEWIEHEDLRNKKKDRRLKRSQKKQKITWNLTCWSIKWNQKKWRKM